MKKQLISTFAALTILTTQALPMAEIAPMDAASTAITASAADYAPTKVSGVKASGTAYTATTLSWTKVANAKGYRVYIYDTAAKKYKKITTITKNSTTSYKVTGLTAGTAYKFKVRAYRKVNGKTYWGKSSAALSVTTKSYAPAKVTGVKATANSKTAGTLTWSKISTATGYRVYVYNTSTKKYTKVTTLSGSTKTSYKVTGLTAGTSYKYKVRAYRKVNGVTYWGTSSAAVTLTTQADATEANTLKAYEALIVGNSTTAQRELIRQDVIAYINKNYPALKLDESLSVFLDKNGNPTDIYSEQVEFGHNNGTTGVDYDELSTAYYLLKTNPSSPMADYCKRMYGDSLSDYAKQLRNDCLTWVDHDAEYYKGVVPLNTFNVCLIYKDTSHIVEGNTGIDIPEYQMMIVYR